MKHLPNILTLSRIPLLFIIVGLLWISASWTNTIALGIFLLAAISDWLDGYIARKVGAVSNFGKLMDALTDKIIMVGLFVALLGLRWERPGLDGFNNTETLLPQFCIFFVMIIICREFLITGLRLVAASNGLVLAAERAGKIKTALQMISVSLLLFALALAKDWAVSFPEIKSSIMWIHSLGLITFYLAVILTIYSGTGYLIRNWKIFINESSK